MRSRHRCRRRCTGPDRSTLGNPWLLVRVGEPKSASQPTGGSNRRAAGRVDTGNTSATFELGHDAGPSTAGRSTVGLHHLAWEVDTLGELARLADALRAAGALVGATDHGTTKSLYARDPDGHELEVVWLVPAALLDDAALEARRSLRPLDLPATIERYGPMTAGGVGISH
ncbi:MAG: VOC family protein [Acidimicrobiia bacterium]|nr:VOC family protein [Acidimicrobiia bacterium]